eukprot:CAMPEP_0183433134 /NCGR_PEP_ID=MMETSP0370-20130417/61186_1 /TAXON_ID=268820 /ORGANISM="Peridinium aciculiferum, Strain PAER-2" /LENGTH=55 /DNA_ID=CAMNT_0025619375 /DNA_START=13 /DNA_END=177 /DNA_ORIENTATION=+
MTPGRPYLSAGPTARPAHARVRAGLRVPAHACACACTCARAHMRTCMTPHCAAEW